MNFEVFKTVDLVCPFCEFNAPDPWFNWSWRGNHDAFHQHADNQACGKDCCSIRQAKLQTRRENAETDVAMPGTQVLDQAFRAPHMPFSRNLRKTILFNIWETGTWNRPVRVRTTALMIPAMQVVVVLLALLPFALYFNL